MSRAAGLHMFGENIFAAKDSSNRSATEVSRVPKKTLALLVFLVPVLLVACGGGDGGGGGNCPRCDAAASDQGYGDLVFGTAGPDAKAREIVDDCGFRVHNGHNGGVGETLQIGGCEAQGELGVILVWSFQEFSGYRVCRPGFRGDIDPPLGDGECRIVGSNFRP